MTMIGAMGAEGLRGKTMKKILICICLVVILLTGCGEKPFNPEDEASSAFSDKQTGCVCEDNGCWIYYDAVEEQSICRVRNDGQELSVILNYQSLLEFEGQSITGLWVIDDILFFRTTYKLFRHNLLSKKTDEIYYDARQIGFSGNDIYFVGRESTIYQMNIHDNVPTPILKSDADFSDSNKNNWKYLYKNFVIVDDVLYYYMRNPDGLYRYQNNESILIYNSADVHEFSMFEYNKELYFVDLGETTDILMKYSPEDGSLTQSAEIYDYVSGTKIQDGCFYYQDSDGKEQCAEINLK